MAVKRVASRLRPFIPYIALALSLALAAPSNAQLTGLPTLTTNNPLIGATTSSSSSSSPSSSRSSTTSSAATTTGGTTTSTDGATATTGGISVAHLSALPTIYGVGVPPLIVPDTSDAPFMKKSDFPEGFIFICVGAILAILALSVIAWRVTVAWSLQRSVKRAAAERYMPEKKSMHGAPTNYSSVYQSVNVSLEHLAAGDTYYTDNTPGQQRSSKSFNKTTKRQSSNPVGSSLFFSPTAGAGRNTSARTSTYLPSGYYASGASTLAGGAGIAHLGGPPTAAYGRVGEAFSDSPPITPGLGPQHVSGHERSGSHDYLTPLDTSQQSHQRSRSNLRTSTDQVSSPGSGRRAPSAMLDDLFDHSTSMR